MKKLALLFAALMLLALLSACGETEGPGILVRKVEGLPEDFLLGADVSSLLAQEASGVVYRDFAGREQDLLKTLSQCGINCIRVRVWVDPYDEQGRGYGGGNCDLNTALEIGKRAAENGMSLLVDFHYSDFWADPAKQQAPKAWQGMDLEEKEQAVYDYTLRSMQRLMEAGIPVRMVQVGNEINNGFCGETGIPNRCRLMAAASRAIRESAPETLIAVHFANPESANYLDYAYKLSSQGVDYDVFASSYYPYWHGTLENLKEKLSAVADRYGKKVMIAETSWAYTDQDSDGSGNSIGEERNYDKPYPFTVQGQAREISDVIRAMAELGDRAVGVFYWEPAWIAVPGNSWEERSAKWEQFGSGWASSWAGAYDPDDAGVYYGGSACDNQALFDPEGRPMESLKTFTYVRTGTEVPIRVDSVEPVYLSVKRNNPLVLPDTVPAIMNDGSEQLVPVVWDESADPAAISSSELGVYPVGGSAEGETILCYVSVVEENYLEDPSFEGPEHESWQITEIAGGQQTDFQIKTTDAFSGETSLHFWNPVAVEFRVEQTVSGLRPGRYRFSIQAQGGDIGAEAEMKIYAISDGQLQEQSFLVDGWRNWQNPEIGEILCENGEITVGVYVKTAGGGWGTLDDFLLNPVG